MSIFLEATKQHLRFNLGNGEVTTEDLWSYSLERLDNAYSVLHRDMEASKQTSLLKPKTDTSKLLELKLSVIKEVVETKLADKQAKETKALRANQARIIRKKLANKKEASLDALSIEDLEKQLAELED